MKSKLERKGYAILTRDGYFWIKDPRDGVEKKLTARLFYEINRDHYESIQEAVIHLKDFLGRFKTFHSDLNPDQERDKSLFFTQEITEQISLMFKSTFIFSEESPRQIVNLLYPEEKEIVREIIQEVFEHPNLHVSFLLQKPFGPKNMYIIRI